LAISLLVSDRLARMPALLLVAALFVIAWHFPLDNAVLQRGWRVLGISIKFYAVCILWLILLRRLWQEAPDLSTKTDSAHALLPS
ncbi:MAG TPA: hypothetical protein VF551_08885, partial [Chthoniobacterales bacterium]